MSLIDYLSASQHLSGAMDFIGRRFGENQSFVTKHCMKCGKEFETKSQNGYTCCKECNK
jgi:protein-arginine kinase activator protein McsA